MIPQPQSVKHYRSAAKRFLHSAIEQFLETECPKMFGPFLCSKLAEKLVELLNALCPPAQYLRPGQIVWTATAVNSRPDQPNLQLVPVILTLIDPSDVQELVKGTRMSHIAQKAIARITRQAFDQGALLSMRDIGLFTWRQNSALSQFRIQWEKDHGAVLPHLGSVQDFGSCVSHKTVIIRKAVLEKKDPKTVALETRHSQRAVDRYLKDFHRVRTCYDHNHDLDFICLATGMSKYLVKQYIDIIGATDV